LVLSARILLIYAFLYRHICVVLRFFFVEMVDVKEQRVCVKFRFKLGKKAFGDDTLGQTKSYDWFNRFKNGRTSVDDDELSGRPSTSTTPENVAKVREVIREDRRRTIHDVCNIVGLSYGTCQRIWSEELNMRHIAAKFVPRLLTDDQKQHSLEVSMELKKQVRNDPDFLYKVVTGDESLIHVYDPETKQKSSQWKYPSSPRPKKARQVKSNVKSMQICFFDFYGITQREFVPTGQTVNAKFYCGVLRWLRENTRRKRSENWRTKNLVLHHDNAPLHATLAVQLFLASKNMTVVPHPLLS
jgi:histone-lysine N-methyltransferase SETMAR